MAAHAREGKGAEALMCAKLAKSNIFCLAVANIMKVKLMPCVGERARQQLEPQRTDCHGNANAVRRVARLVIKLMRPLSKHTLKNTPRNRMGRDNERGVRISKSTSEFQWE